MKKAIVLLLALAAVTGAFAQTPAVSGSATLSWGIDLDTNYTGFSNTYTADVTIPFGVADAEATGEGTYGYIAITGVTFELTGDPTTGTYGFNGADADGYTGSLEAKIVSGNLYAMVYSHTAMDATNYGADIVDGEVSANIDADLAGTEIGITGDYAFALIMNSKGDWNANTASEYAFGAKAALKLIPDMLTLNLMAGYDMFEATKDMFVAVKAPITLLGTSLKLTPAFDGLYTEATSTFTWDARLAATYTFNEDGTYADLIVYYGADEDLEVKVGFKEVRTGGFVDGLLVSGWFTYADFLDDAANTTYWKAEANFEYKTMLDDVNYVMPFAYFTMASTPLTTLKAGVSAMLIPNTVFTLQYNSDDLQSDSAANTVSDKGEITFAAKITL